MNSGLEGQRYESMLHGPDGRHNCDRHARTPTQNLEARYQIAVVSHLLGRPPDERPHEHAIEGRRQWQAPKEVRRRECPVHEPARRIDATENECEAHRDEREGEQHIPDEARHLKPRRSNSPMPSRRVAATAAPGIRRRLVSRIRAAMAQPHAMGSATTVARRRPRQPLAPPRQDCAREQHRCRAAPCQRSGGPPAEEGLVGIRVQEWHAEGQHYRAAILYVIVVSASPSSRLAKDPRFSIRKGVDLPVSVHLTR